ncbi:MAG: phosphotransferase, partial [Firmicutes bacterium]|nr:phosphotransferase [Bacillota bacterium]
LKAAGVPAGSVNTHYLLETRKGKFYLKIDEVKSPAAVQQELELLLFLRAEGFPCPHPLAGRHGEYLTRHKGKNVSLYAAIPGQALPEDVLTPTHLEAIGHALASLHVLGQGYKKPVENRFSFERITELYQDMKEKMPAYFRHLIHTIDDEVAYQQQYREDDPVQPRGGHDHLPSADCFAAAGRVPPVSAEARRQPVLQGCPHPVQQTVHLLRLQRPSRVPEPHPHRHALPAGWDGRPCVNVEGLTRLQETARHLAHHPHHLAR